MGNKKVDNKLTSWQLNSKIEKLVNSNITEVPYEGAEVNKHGLREGILDLIYELCPEYRPEGWGNGSPW